MAIASNTFLTYSAKGIREDLSNVIYNISPEETPFVSNIGKGSISNTLFDWPQPQPMLSLRVTRLLMTQ